MRFLGAIISVVGTLMCVGSFVQLIYGRVYLSNFDKITGWVGATGLGVLTLALGLRMADRKKPPQDTDAR